MSLQSRLLVALLVLLTLAVVALAAVLAQTYDRQLRSIAEDRVQKDVPVLRSGLDEFRLRDLRLASLIAGDGNVVSGTDAHDSAALDKVLGPLRTQIAPVAAVLAVVDPKGQIISTDPFTQLNFSGDAPVKDALQGRRDGNPATSRNALFFVRPAFPVLSVETAWPVRVNNKVVGAVVLLNAVNDDTFNVLLAQSQLQAAIVAPQQRAMLAASAPLRQLQQQQKLQGLMDNLDQKGSLFRQTVGPAEQYSFVAQPFPTAPAATWLLLGVTDKDLATPLQALKRQLAIVGGASLLVLLLAGCGVAWLLLRPLRQLRKAAAAAAGGREVPAAPRLAPPEVRDIAGTLATLSSELSSGLETERRQRAQVESIIDSMAEGVVVSDVNRHVTLVNPVAKRLLGINGSDPSALPGDLIPLNGSGRNPVQLAANSKVIKSRSAPIVGPDGRTTGFVTLLHDASEEAELDRLKSDFVGIVSHELRTPLTSIKGSVDLLLEDETGDLNSTQKRFLTTIRRSSDRLINLVNDLLDLSRLEAGRVQLDLHPVDARHLVEDTVNNLANLFAARKQTVRVDCQPDLPPILADRQRMEQVLVNLLGNASKYTPEGGVVDVCAKRSSAALAGASGSPRSMAVATVGGGSDAGFVQISVSDTGPGLSADEQARIFEKFYRAGDSLTQQQTGSGLGLPIARSLVALHGGSLSVDSAPGRGSTFAVTLPSYEGEE